MPKEAANAALVEAKKVDDVWSKKTQFTMQDVTLEQFKAAMAACQTGDEEVEAILLQTLARLPAAGRTCQIGRLVDVLHQQRA